VDMTMTVMARGGGVMMMGVMMMMMMMTASLTAKLMLMIRLRGHARPAPRAQGVDRQVQGRVRPGVGRHPQQHLPEAEGRGHHSRQCQADGAPGVDPRLGRLRRRQEEALRANDGGERIIIFL
jgi:hypothetical protein